MAKLLVTDKLWNIIEPLLPPPKRRRKHHPGRKPVDNRVALTGILFVLKTGIAWEDLPQEIGCSGMTCWRRLRDWQKKGVWEKLHLALLERLQKDEVLDWSRAVIDSSSLRAIKKGMKQAEIRLIEAKREASII